MSAPHEAFAWCLELIMLTHSCRKTWINAFLRMCTRVSFVADLFAAHVQPFSNSTCCTGAKAHLDLTEDKLIEILKEINEDMEMNR